MKKFSKILLLAALLMQRACASLSDLRARVWGEDTSRTPASQAKTSSGSLVIHEGKFNGTYNTPAAGADLGRNEFGVPSNNKNNPWFGTGPENEGSLWNGDTQDNFYFTANTFFKVGDLVTVQVDSDVNDALNARILALLGDRVKSVRKVASEEAAAAVKDEVSQKIDGAVKNDRLAGAIGGAVGASVESALDISERYVNLDEIPVRITEALPNRVFNVSGSRKVFIKNAPYQVVFSGKMRHEDIGKDGKIMASNVLESKLELTK